MSTSIVSFDWIEPLLSTLFCCFWRCLSDNIPIVVPNPLLEISPFIHSLARMKSIQQIGIPQPSKKFHISFIPTPSVVLATRNTFSHFQHLVYTYTCISSSRLPALSSRTRQAPRYLSVIVSIHSQIRDSGRIAAEESLICIHPCIIQLPQGYGLLPRELFL